MGHGDLMVKVSASHPLDRGFEPHTGHYHDTSIISTPVLVGSRKRTGEWVVNLLHNRAKINMFKLLWDTLWIFIYQGSIKKKKLHCVAVLTLNLLYFHLWNSSMSFFREIMMKTQSWSASSREPGQTAWMCRLAWLLV